ncbi:MAG: sugar phosphate isomerase/epimerase family protein [Opitutaceae bacterium]|nr:sugar phosphate isomerase/epimerase family protein [Opitutaceae bacterium]
MNPAPSRRQFLKTSLGTLTLTAGLGSLSSFAADAVAPRKRAMKKGFMLNAFPGRAMPVAKQFQLLKEAGFDGVEPRSHLNQDEVLRARDATGLSIPSVTCGTHSRLLAQGARSQWQGGVDGIQQALRDAKRYGASSILVVPGLVTENISYEENYQRTQAGIRACIPLAEELGVTMAIENVWNNFLMSPMEAARYVDEFKSAAVGFHLDIGNMMYLGWPEQWIRTLGKRIAKVHIKEFSRKKMNQEGLRQGFQVEYLEGDNNWPAIMKALDDVGYRSWAIVEPAYKPKDVEGVERLKQISERLDRIIAS